jgi:hypothetical protein
MNDDQILFGQAEGTGTRRSILLVKPKPGHARCAPVGIEIGKVTNESFAGRAVGANEFATFASCDGR